MASPPGTRRGSRTAACAASTTPDARSWTASPIRLLVASEPFAQGGLAPSRTAGAELVAENAADGARAATVDVARRPWAERGVVSAPELTYELVGADDDDDDAARRRRRAERTTS